MKRYSVVQIGLGARGITHLKGFQNHQARIEIAGICGAPEPFAVNKQKKIIMSKNMMKESKL